jgi:hypothetical protein
MKNIFVLQTEFGQGDVEAALGQIGELKPDRLMISPGPCSPKLTSVFDFDLSQFKDFFVQSITELLRDKKITFHRARPIVTAEFEDESPGKFAVQSVFNDDGTIFLSVFDEDDCDGEENELILDQLDLESLQHLRKEIVQHKSKE